ncbi:hypothetical protein ACLMAJ_26855 [Nocardia sp. KC 131]|uniref:hypothetical protein n=1 Tax=Nocardia arseniciresistens TaxID=3392119 RepID=UPI00398F4604
MSIVILKGRHEGVDHGAQSWLAATELAGNADATLRLSRAVNPLRYGFTNREPLDLAQCTGEAAEHVIELLIAGQVPTPGAVSTAVANPPNMKVAGIRELERAASKQLRALVRGDYDTLGEELSSSVALHWANYGFGPTWQEACQSDAVVNWWTFALGEVPEFRLARNPMFTILDQSGWIASNPAPRSLCAGRRFHNRFYGDHVSPASATTIGYLVARYVGIYRRLHNDRSPTWAEVTASTADRKGIPLFFNAGDGQAQQRWLVTQGWIRIEDDQLRRGERAKSETRRRTALRKASAATQAA